MPPVSMDAAEVSKEVHLVMSSRKSPFKSSSLTVGSMLTVLTCALFSQDAMSPKFSPAMPPVMFSPMITPVTVHSVMAPSVLFRPAIPPIFALPVTVPSKWQFITAPWFSPTMPPTVLASPVGATRALTVKSLTTAVCCNVPNNPAGVVPLSNSMPLMVWPFPSKVPPKTGMGVKSTPSKEMSASKTTRFPTDQVSRRQFSISSIRSSASLM